MSRSLPARAHLEHLRKQAKDLLRAHRSGEPQAAARLRAHLVRLSSERDLAVASISLQEAQFVVAREYGFSSWPELLREVGPSTEQISVLRTVQDVHDRLVPALDRLLTEALGMGVEVTAEVRQVPFGHYVQWLGLPFWTYRFHIVVGQEGWAHLAFSLPLCAALLKLEAGTEELRVWEEAIPGIPTDESIGTPLHDLLGRYVTLIARLVIALAPEIERAWAPAFDMGIHDIHLRTVPSTLQDTPTDPAVHIKFEVTSGRNEDLTLSLCYLLSTLEGALHTVANQKAG